MGRLLIFVALAAVVVWWLLGRRRRDAPPPAPPGRPAPPPVKPAEAAEMVACARCGVHLPREDAVRDAEGRLFCGDEHRRAGPR